MGDMRRDLHRFRCYFRPGWPGVHYLSMTLQALSAQFESVLEMPPPTTSPISKLSSSPPIVDFTNLQDQDSWARWLEVARPRVLSGALHSPRDLKTAPVVSPPVG